MKIDTGQLVTGLAGGIMLAAIVWLSSNVVFAEDLEKLRSDVNSIERTLLQGQRRDISRDIRALESKAVKSSDDIEELADLEADLQDIQDALDGIDD